MLVRKNDETEIWTDTMKKGTSKKCISIAIFGMLVFICLAIFMRCDFSIIETYYFLAMLFFPCILILICGLIFKNRENNKNMILRVNKEFIEILGKKENKKIELKQINKVNTVSSMYGSFIVIFYKENNIEKKYSFQISAANRGLVMIALKEYKKDIVTNK